MDTPRCTCGKHLEVLTLVTPMPPWPTYYTAECACGLPWAVLFRKGSWNITAIIREVTKAP